MEFRERRKNDKSEINPQLRQGFLLDDVVVLPNDGEVIIHGQRKHLPPKAMEVLLFMSANQNQVLSSKRLLAFGWGDTNANRSNLTHIISEIRQALDDHKECPEFIQTLARKGYRLIAKVKPLDQKILYPNIWPMKSPTQSPNAKSLEMNSHWHLSLALFKNSKLLSVSAAFVISTWVLIQILEVLFPIFDVPEWGLKIAVLILVIGFPLLLLFTWLREIRVRKHLFSRQKESPRKSFFFKQLAFDFGFIGLLSIGVGFLALYLIDSIESEQNTPLAEATEYSMVLPVKDNLIAVLPFQFNTGELLPDYFKATFQGELISALNKQKDFNMVSQRAVNELPTDSSLSIFAKRLGARYLLDGSIVGEQAEFTIMLSLTDTQTALQVWSSTVRGTPQKLLSVQKELYRQVFNALGLIAKHPGITSERIITTDDFKSYDSYIQGKSYLASTLSSEVLAKAESHFLKALEYDPGFTQASAGLCQTYLDQYELNHHLSAFESAKQLCSALTNESDLKGEAFVALGNLNRISGQHGIAIDFYQNALKLDPANLNAIIGTAQSQDRLGNAQQAENLLQKAIQIEPGYWKNYLSLGDLLFANGKYREASEQYARVTILKPDYDQGFNRLGGSYYLDDNLEQASVAWQRSINISPSANIYANLGTAFFFSHQFGAARDNYQKASMLKPSDPNVWGNQGDAEKFLGEEVQAKISYQKALKLSLEQLQVNPHDATIQAMIARYQSELDLCDPALKSINGLAEKTSSDPYLFYDMAIVAVNCQQPAFAKQLLEQVIKHGYSQKLLARDVQFSSIDMSTLTSTQQKEMQ